LLQLSVPNDPEEYNHIKPSSQPEENTIKKATNVKFFEDWFPQHFPDEDTESRPRTVAHIELNIPSSRKKLTIADIDKRARAVIFELSLYLLCPCITH
jgi:hypothetical protein